MQFRTQKNRTAASHAVHTQHIATKVKEHVKTPACPNQSTNHAIIAAQKRDPSLQEAIIGKEEAIAQSKQEQRSGGATESKQEDDPPAALLAEAALLAGDDDAGGLGVGLADAVLPVIVLDPGEVQPAPLDLAPHLSSPAAVLAPGTLRLPLLPAAPRRRVAGGGARARGGVVSPVPEQGRRGGRGRGLQGRPLHAGDDLGWSIRSDLGIEKRGGGRGGEQCGLWRRRDGGKRIWNRKRQVFISPLTFLCILMSFLYTFSHSLFCEDLFIQTILILRLGSNKRRGTYMQTWCSHSAFKRAVNRGKREQVQAFHLTVFTLHSIMHTLIGLD